MSEQLKQIFSGLHDSLETSLGFARGAIDHSGLKGDESEQNWVDLFQEYLPKRYETRRAKVIDSNGDVSDQIDIVIHDRQYSPFILKQKSVHYVPAESVYAVFEVKQVFSKDEFEYAAQKALSVRNLVRTSLPIPYANGTYAAKKPHRILSGLLALDSKWNPPLGAPFESAVLAQGSKSMLDLGCCVKHGSFEVINPESSCPSVVIHKRKKTLAFFLLKLISRLQDIATVPRLDVMAYAKWLPDDN